MPEVNSLFIQIRACFCKNANNLAELIFILNRRTQCSHKRRMPLVIPRIHICTTRDQILETPIFKKSLTLPVSSDI